MWYHTFRWQLNQTLQLGIGSADIKRTFDLEAVLFKDDYSFENGVYPSYRVW